MDGGSRYGWCTDCELLRPTVLGHGRCPCGHLLIAVPPDMNDVLSAVIKVGGWGAADQVAVERLGSAKLRR